MTTQRLDSIIKTKLLEGIRVIVTGCGYKDINHVFYDTKGIETHDSIPVELADYAKANIGTATSFVLAANRANIQMVSRNKHNLREIQESISLVLRDSLLKPEYSVVDLLDEKETQDFVDSLPRDKPIYWFNSIGLGASSYELKDDNPYLHIEDISLELLEQETRTILRSTHNLLTKLIPIFKKQKETRIAIVSSMSAIRGYSRGGTHCAAKGAISRYTNSAMLDLWKDNIFITDIRPGAIDTGMYDNNEVQNAVCEISDEYGGSHRNRFALAPPISVGYAALTAFTSPAHITSINLVAQGQFPNEGS